MTAITPALIKELREMTGVGMSDCKAALTASNGSIPEAVDWLRKKGMASAAKKEGRATNEGMLGAVHESDAVAVVELNAETDFVVRNQKFQDFLPVITQIAAKARPASLEAFLGYAHEGMTIDEHRSALVQSIGENIQIRRVHTFTVPANASVGIYSHSGGKIITVVVIEGSDQEEALARDIAMHVAAASPAYLKPENVPAEVIENEKEIARSQVVGKPAGVIDKIVEGKVNAFLDAVCLLRQKFVKDDSKTIQQLVEEHAKQIGKPLQVISYLRWSIGS